MVKAEGRLSAVLRARAHALVEAEVINVAADERRTSVLPVPGIDAAAWKSRLWRPQIGGDGHFPDSAYTRLCTRRSDAQ